MRALRAVTALLGLALAGSLAAWVGPAAAAEPLAGAPEVGRCYDITYRQMEAPALHEPTIDCSVKHTLRVDGVGRLPAGLTWRSSAAKLERAALKICAPAWRKTYGSSLRDLQRTLYQRVFFYPTKAQQRAGARWVSCEIGLLSGMRLQALPEEPVAVTDATPEDSIARCGTKRFVFVVCSKRHAYRTTFTFAAKGRGDQDRAASRAAARVCPRRVDSPRDFMWSWGAASARKIVVGCLTKTRK